MLPFLSSSEGSVCSVRMQGQSHSQQWVPTTVCIVQDLITFVLLCCCNAVCQIFVIFIVLDDNETYYYNEPSLNCTNMNINGTCYETSKFSVRTTHSVS